MIVQSEYIIYNYLFAPIGTHYFAYFIGKAFLYSLYKPWIILRKTFSTTGLWLYNKRTLPGSMYFKGTKETTVYPNKYTIDESVFTLFKVQNVLYIISLEDSFLPIMQCTLVFALYSSNILAPLHNTLITVVISY